MKMGVGFHGLRIINRNRNERRNGLKLKIKWESSENGIVWNSSKSE